MSRNVFFSPRSRPWGPMVFALAFIVTCLSTSFADGPGTLEVASAGSIAVRDLDDLQRLEKRAKFAIGKTLNATVSVQVGRGSRGGYAFGSGVIVSEDGYVLTAAHVSSRPNQVVRLRLSDGRTASGVTLGLQKDLDMGLMKITDEGPWPYLKRARASKLKAGDWVIAAGHPGGFDQEGPALVRLGRILKSTSKVLLTDCTLVGGDSGGPLVDLNGNVVGIHSRIGADLTTNLHVPVDRFAENWDRLAKREVWGLMVTVKPWIGVEHSPSFSAARIREVRVNSPAQRAGLLAGDTVVQFNNVSVKGFDQLKRLVSKQNPGEQVAIQYRRNDVLIETMIDIGKRESRADSQTRDDAELLKDWLDQIDVRRRSGRPVAGIGKNADQVKESFHDVLEKASKATVEVYDGGSIVALGTIVDEHLILSKASQIRGNKIKCRFRGSRSFTVERVAELRSHDLVLLKASRSLPSSNLTASKTPSTGTLLATSGLNIWPLAVGVVSSGATDIPSEGKLGIVMDTDAPVISNIVNGSGADQAGLRLGDRISKLDGIEVATSNELVDLITMHFPGDVLRISYVRDGQVFEATAELGRYSEFDEALAEFEDFIGGKLSERRTGFERVLQHDTAIRPRHCGGPVVDAYGRFVGINIARSARTTSFLLPAEEVKSALRQLKSLRTDKLETVDVGAAGN